MKARIALVIAAWALAVFAAVRLFDDIAVPAAGTVLLMVVALVVIGRARRPHPVPLPLDLPVALELPTGPRRVLLLEAGMTGPE